MLTTAPQSRGVREVTHGPDAIFLMLGEPVTVAGAHDAITTPLTLPHDAAEARATLNRILAHTGWRAAEPTETDPVYWANRHSAC